MQLLRFCGAGVPGVLLYYIVYVSLTRLTDQWYVAATVVASIASWGLTFLLQKYWAFRNKESEWLMRQIINYAGKVLFFIFILGPGLIYLLVEHAELPDLWAQAILTLVVSSISYLIDKRIFANKKTAASSP
ncbi:hypothetical protein A3H65_02010 [Candidatus Giovannonibacteria bacterium RIFCSPLOWO2_02_FULL_45_14]|uniref:GtrA/DPMS transmembrane domain-containing protein n=1 Tax=Candidatus Giovannonibacteria bacterium RIFCSPLOWO2_12_FULL_44_15 TaxID=1798364 RepID=A0A1F5Y137_9BACT|nr:MAG: hypothetical protein A3C75_01915 [Candidatus Giovannonibacteria bacterium RIFCSPHIGHO2_02_FULL_44_31]OGF77031.1 MAG: hypothetical protein A3E62_04175 [Candidatus Giovannonibacteria bacterium RIFCSPHIGHO2_12_FULL_44_29]OGF90738.1 MAG: hypothetical protein A3H65_02010 [Candidatus Giovannonibacteria bacterium RIFCSPLOWO2_02_FULL_45_14]OGF93864.1 MAG: hypothetical protein A3G54_03840 [Candidatus Giovannonibacteria bacterium RIFCSPLOWO2_12_FULL_44_15]